MKQLRPKELKRYLKGMFKHDMEIHLFLDNIQYTRNVAELFRIADATTAKKIYMYGITPNPPFGKDMQKVSRKKEYRVEWEKIENENQLFMDLKKKGFSILALELTDESINITDHKLGSNKILVILGNEVNGISKRILKYADKSIMIPMYGKGASMNVSVSAAVLIYYFLLNHDKGKKD